MKMQMIAQTEFDQVRRWIFRHARPIDLARWLFHFESGDKEAVLKALSAYQNEDGGFGHALEADSWNPHTSPIQTWAATEIIREIGGVDASHPIIQNILRYLASGRDTENGLWLASVPSNNDYPHAPWWTFDNRVIEAWGYNPTACLAGFILEYADRGSDLFDHALTIAKRAVAHYLSGQHLNEMHECACFIRLMEYCEKAKLQDTIDIEALRLALGEQVSSLLTKDTDKWKTDYVCKPSSFILTPMSSLYQYVRDYTGFEMQFILDSRNEEGVWNIPWKWQAYEDAFAISANWWKANVAILNMLFLKNFQMYRNI